MKIWLSAMFIKCCCCKKHMGWKDGEGRIGTSHSICPECSEKME